MHLELQEKYRNVQIASIAGSRGNLYNSRQASHQDSLILILGDENAEIREHNFMYGNDCTRQYGERRNSHSGGDRAE